MRIVGFFWFKSNNRRGSWHFAGSGTAGRPIGINLRKKINIITRYIPVGAKHFKKRLEKYAIMKCLAPTANEENSNLILEFP